jgi:signal transduction histidine kinase
MKLRFKENLLWPIGLLALAGVLIALAVLQYRWTQELDQAAGDRMRAGLQASMIGMREDLSRELLSIPLALQFDWQGGGSSVDPEYVTERLDVWKRTASHPDLVANVYIARSSGNGTVTLQRLNSTDHKYDSVDWPSRLSSVRDALGRMPEIAMFRLHTDRPHPAGPPGGRPAPGPGFQHGPPPTPWIIDETVPALLHPDLGSLNAPRAGEQIAPEEVNWIVIELNPDVVRKQVLPELAQRYFGSKEGLTYDVAVITRTRDIFYSSNEKFGTGANIPTDARIRLFGPPIGHPGPSRDIMFGGFREEPRRREQNLAAGHGWPLRLQPLRRGSEFEGDWELIVKHSKGSLEAALASTRRGHLMISFGVLLLLAVTMGMLIAVTRRAHRLASLQMQFVTGVSHELRTPLAVIASAADNIADGIIEDRTKIARYGRVIRDQSRQLTQLVEQILLFAATRQNGYQYNLRSFSPAELVETALSNSAEMIRNAGFTVDKGIDATPDVVVDLPAASHCLQNLIANAVKYGGDARWIGIRVHEAEDNKNKREVQIAVQDKGIGIEPREQQRIFDAFYRSPAATGAQIHGTGLGLALARRTAEAMGGRLTVTSSPGEGSTFVLHLPCAGESSAQPDEAMTAAGTTND